MGLPGRGELEIRSADPGHVIALYNPLVIVYFAREPKTAELKMLRDLVEEGRREKIHGGMLFVVARRNIIGGIDPEVRQFFEKMVRENSAEFGASAAVVLMQGFAGAMIRSFIGSLLLLSGQRKMLQVFGSIEHAGKWLGPLHGLDVAQLIKAYRRSTMHLQTDTPGESPAPQ